MGKGTLKFPWNFIVLFGAEPAWANDAEVEHPCRQTLASIVLAMVSAQVDDAQTLAGSYPPESRMAVVALGRCGDHLRVGQAAQRLREEFRQQRQAGTAILSENDTAASALHTGGDPQGNRFGRTDFENQNYGKAIATFRSILPEIDRLPLGADR